VVQDEQKEQIFSELIGKSWKIFSEREMSSKLDEVLVGAVIAAYVKTGNLLIDINSDGTRHYIRFENSTDKSRLIVRVNNWSEDFVRAKVQGHLAEVIVGYGQKADNMTSVWSTLKSEMKSAFIMENEPGIVTFDADVTGGYIYAQVPLILNIDDYLKGPFDVDNEKLTSHLDAVVHSLKRYLQGRMQSA